MWRDGVVVRWCRRPRAVTSQPEGRPDCDNEKPDDSIDRASVDSLRHLSLHHRLSRRFWIKNGTGRKFKPLIFVDA